MFERIARGASRCWWALVAGGRAARRSFEAWRSDDDRFFEPLTPVFVEDDRAARYERELLRALHNEEVLNIAITGGYGAGKSSVLKTFFEHHRGFKHTFVSLATFTKAKAPTTAQKPSDESAGTPIPGAAAIVAASSDGTASADLINRIEETIVQQLLYAVQAKQLPKTRLKRISHASTLRVCWRTLCVAVIGICALRLGAPKLQTLSTVAKDWALNGLMWVPEPIALGVVVAGGVWALYSGLKLLSLFSIDGLTLKGGKLEATHHGSVLHKNIDEIIYCFERSDIDVVVIEDLDRFDIQEIFFRLREINFIIRQSPQVKRPIHFIYALRDEMFTVTDKTKFFDLIIPIIPVVNSENSREKLIELLRKRHVGGQPLNLDLTPKLIETVGYHIDEMRLIKNIVNEFDIYANILANDGLVLDPNKLFAMVALRNLHPEVYSDLLKRRGVVFQAIEGYPAWTKSEVQRHQLAIAALKKRRATREAEVATDLASLRACVWFELIRRGGLRSANALYSEDQTAFSLLEFVEEESFDQVVNLRNVYPTQYSRSFGNPRGEAQSPKAVLKDLSYAERVAGLEVSIDDIDEEISGLQRKITKLKTMPFREACNDGYGDSLSPQLKGYELITFLLHRGYLDTDYTDYLGYFYEGSLTQSDKKLTMALARGEMLDVGTPIRNPERVVSKLDLDSVDKGKGLLVHLMAELVRPRQDDAEAREEKLSVILKSSHHHMGRLSEAVELLPEEDRSAFIKALFRNDSNLINQLLSYDKANLAREDLVVIVLDSLSADQVEQLQGRRGTLLKVINDLREVSKLVPGLASGQLGWAWLKEKPAQFCNVSDATTAEDLKALVEWGCISPTMPMLRLLCSTLEPYTEVGTVSHHRLGQLGLVGFDGLVEKSPSKYVGELLGQMGILDETEASLLAVLALLQDEDDLRLAMFERTTCMLTELDKLPSLLWLPALQSERLSNAGNAAWTFFDGVVIAPNSDTKSSDNPARPDLGSTAIPIFVEFLTRNASTLANELWGVEGEEELQTFLIQNEQVSNDTLKTLFSSIVLAPSVLVKGAVPMARWVSFSNAAFVPFSSEIRELIAQYDPSVEARYIAHHWRKARDILSLSALPVRLVTCLSRSGVASLADTMTMWQGITAEMFSTWEGSVEELANACVRANKEQATFPSSYLPVIMHCLSDTSVSTRKRTEMIIQALQMNCSWADVAKVLPLLGEEHGALVVKKRAHLPTSEDDRKLVEALKRRGFVGAVRFEAKRTVVFSKRNQIA
ncbi:hypothetical protein [Metapseudomonas resinovorans]|uniref:YobI-like P-loop NTPase domain-containing protein n=1 Tax=Metapseudomonas resinovorans NBRC 106553 TaxID=1245471 RepID=S6AVJ5_METRE|nr:hypothetical protein [Pseudomonas resinovorans]BAN48481.1 hypothetical protein PCA10_27490 [Pseudomonas resinovorans NBRC 106553]